MEVNMWDKIKTWPLFVKLIMLGAVLVLAVIIFDKGSTMWAHYKGWKSDQEYSKTIEKSNELTIESAKHKAKAEEFEKLAEVRNAQIEVLNEQSKKYGLQAAENAKKVDETFNQLEQDKQFISTASDDELRYKICKDRHDLGFADIGQCKGWKSIP